MRVWWVALVLLLSCGGDSSSDSEVVVFAAASLTDVFAQLAAEFEEAHPGVDVVVNAAASSALATQILEGAPADVFASADYSNMTKVGVHGDVSGTPVVFATNRLEIMVEDGNPLGITGLDDLADRDLVVVTCAPEVPCGIYATEVFDRAGVDVTSDSYETNVRSVVTKVTLGEADVGVVYATDVEAAADGADGVSIPDAVNVIAEYPIAVLADAPNRTGADDFVAHVTGATGRAVLAEFGFGVP